MRQINYIGGFCLFIKPMVSVMNDHFKILYTMLLSEHCQK